MTKSAEPAPILQFHRRAAHALASASLERDGYAADIFHNPEQRSKPWTFILTRDGSPEVLYWGRERTLELAQKACAALLEALTPQTAAG